MLLNATKHSESAKYACKSNAASAENSFNLLLKAINRYLKNGVSKSIVHANFQLYKVHPETEFFRKRDNSRQIYKKRVRLFIHQMMCLKRVEKKKILERHYKVAKWLFNYF